MNTEMEKAKIFDRLKCFKPVLSKWQEIVTDFCEKKDVPWWYNEQASLSLLAGAVWTHKNGWVFEEFSTNKWSTTRKKKRSKSLGRCDIQFGFEKWTFLAEAKQCWPIISQKESAGIKTVKDYLKRARRDSARLPRYENEIKLAILFVVPRIRISIFKSENISAILKSFISHLLNLPELKESSSAWVFPVERRSTPGMDGYRYPGIILSLIPLWSSTLSSDRNLSRFGRRRSNGNPS